MRNEVMNMKETKDLLAKIVYNTALITAEVAVNSTCWAVFYQEKLDSQTEALRKYHDKKNS